MVARGTRWLQEQKVTANGMSWLSCAFCGSLVSEKTKMPLFKEPRFTSLSETLGGGYSLQSDDPFTFYF